MSTGRHVLLRYATRIMDPATTVAAHQSVASDEGTVWFGKVGQPLGRGSVERFNKQISDGVDTKLYVAARVGRDLIAHKAVLVQVCNERSGVPPERVPGYYEEMGIEDSIGTWFEVSGFARLSQSDLGALVVPSSGRSVIGPLLSGRRSYFFVDS